MKIISPNEFNLSTCLLQEECKTLYVAHASSSEETTDCTFALAMSLKKLSAEPVLVIDGNPFNASLSAHFKLQDVPGFSDWVSARSNDHDTYLLYHKENDIHVMGAGHPASAREWCEISTALGARLRDLQTHFSYIVFNGSGLDQQQSLLLAANFGGVILIISENETPNENALHIKQQLDQVGAKLVGSILKKRQHFIPRRLANLS